MRKGLLFLGTFVSFISFGQDCSKIFISEYVEGVGNNKALEIYNPTANPVNLSEYFVGRISNGASISGLAANMCVQLTGTLAPYSTHVGVLDLRNPAGTGQTAPIWDELEAVGDAFYSPVYNISWAFYWNGNDCIILAKGSAANPQAPTTEIVDFFGKDGQDPVNSVAGTNGWSSVAPFNMTSGAPNDVVVTEDHSLIRKQTVLKGKQSIVELLSPTYVFNPLLEYDSIPALLPKLDAQGNILYQADGVTPQVVGNWESLGSHVCNCDPSANVQEITVENASIYPNPSNGEFSIKGAEAVVSVEIFNGLGQKVKTVKNNSKGIISVDLDSKSGLYMVKMTDTHGNSVTKRVIVK